MRTFNTTISIHDYEFQNLSQPEQLCKIIPKYQYLFKIGQFVFGQISIYGGTYNVVGLNNVENLYQSYFCFTYWGNVYLITCNNGNWSYKEL